MRGSEKTCDVLIIGSGMAGACLARQLRLEQPELSVVNIDKKADFDWWVGESTVEAFDDYAMRTLGLGPYLLKNHIVKHGLRFWFDSPAKDLAIDRLSEHGRARYPGLNPGVQIDRAAFDRDMCRMNRELGVDVMLGTSVLGRPDGSGVDIELGGESGHRVATDAGVIRCKHLVDASGRASLLGRRLGILETDREGPFNRGSYWLRLAGCRSIDALGDDEFLRRTDYTLRWASTNHFMYDGYWVWLIPVDESRMSIGLTFDRDLHDYKFKTGEELLAFFRSHRSLEQICGPEARIEDFLGLTHIVRGARRFFSEDRWYLSGMSGHFVDPLFSSNSALLALSNRLICELIATDRTGDRRRLRTRLRHFNVLLRNIFLRQLRSFARYHAFGSFDAFVNWKTLRYHTILNVELPLQRNDFRPLLEMVDSHGEDCDCAEGRWSESQELEEAGDRLTDEFVAALDRLGTYYERNRGYFHELTELPSLRHRSVEGGLGEAARRQSLCNYEAFVRYFVARLCQMEGVPFSDASFRACFDPDWRSGQTLAELVSSIRERSAGADAHNAHAESWNMKGPVGQYTGDPAMEWICRFVGPDGRPPA